MLKTVNEQLPEIMARYNELYVKEEYKVTDKNTFLQWFLGEADYVDESFEICFVEIPRHEAKSGHVEIFEVFLNQEETAELCKEHEILWTSTL